MPKFCNHCGEPLVEAANFCISCGQAQAQPMQTIAPQYQQTYFLPKIPKKSGKPFYKQWWFWLIIFLASCLVASLVGNVVFLVNEVF